MGTRSEGTEGLEPVLVATLTTMPSAVVLFDGDAPVWCNRAAARLLGRPDDDPDLASALASSPDDDTPLRAALRSARSGAATRVDEVSFTTPAGPVVREGWVGPVPGGSGAMVALVLPADEERLHPLLDNTHDIITVLAADGTIKYSNPAAGRLTAYEGMVLSGSNALDLVHPEDRAAVLAALEERDSSEPVRMRLRFGDGTWHPCLVHAIDLLDDPAVGGIVVTVHDISEQIDAHEELARSERWVRRLLAQLTDVVVVFDEHGEMLYVSPSIEALVGTPEERHPGTSAFNTVHPDDLDPVMTTFAAVLEHPDTEHRVTFRLRHEDGHYVWVEAVAVNAVADPAVGGVIATMRDITQLKQAEQMSTGLVSAAPDAMVVVDDAGTVVLANDQAEQLFGWPADELVGQPVELLIPENLRSRHEGHRATYATDPRGRVMGEGIELVAFRRDGSEVPVEVSLSTHETHRGRLTSASIRDITVQRETRRALEAALEGEQQVVQRLREADALKAEFVSTVAHELKGPLSAITGFARMIERLLADEDIRSGDVPMMASRIAVNSERLLEMIEQLLRFSRLEAGEAKLEAEQVEVRSVVERSLDLVREALGDHTVSVEVPAETTMWADADGIANALRNLLSNAAKFGPPGTTIAIEAAETDGGVRISVADEGPGIEPDQREAVFDQFHQTRAGREKGGSGLGLSIARRYVELHDGRIWVEEAPGGGARFCFSLPDRS